MSLEIIQKHMDGTLTATNEEFTLKIKILKVLCLKLFYL